MNRCRHGRNFLNSQSKYNEARFKEIYSKLDEKGIHFVVASGNQYYQLKDFFTDYNVCLR
ncbi:HAD hydrolase family protein [Lactobacillus amylovorus]|uniref:HAD hydrolase family protein n=1 Tax=Lactobacillus amylovorus TaxID=1604 RepID=UPI0029056A10|nr:HAD hydrolase family protein [Lactobacillus amylovorus]